MRRSLTLLLVVPKIPQIRTACVAGLLGSLVCLHSSSAQPHHNSFTDVGAALTPVDNSSAVWGDYDNDGDLDILLTGCADRDIWGFCVFAVSFIYRNDGGSFGHVTTFPGVRNGSVAWGDYDNDNDLDILLTGWWEYSDQPISRVYRNDGNSVFTETATPPAAELGAVAWGDSDNDGDLDILLTGFSAPSPLAYVCRNDGNGAFPHADSPTMEGVAFSSAAWADYDNDADLDILIMGRRWDNLPVTRLYRNEGSGAFTALGSAGLWNLSHGQAVFGDYDDDRDLDVLIAGQRYIPEDGINRLHRNDGSHFQPIWGPGAFMDVDEASVAWGDYDNDGDLDFHLTGMAGLGYTDDFLYVNDGGNGFLTWFSWSLSDVASGSTAWGDYDNDGDLDILITGASGSIVYDPLSKLHRNDGTTINVAPSTPAGLSAQRDASGVSLSWSQATDDRTPTPGLSYNLRIGTTPGGSEIMSPMADEITGYRRVVQLGNAQQQTSWRISVPATHVYWSVQAIDGAFAGSLFAPEQVCCPRKWRVPTDAATISGAMALAAAGDTIEVACATYYEHDLQLESGVYLRSETRDPDCVIIDAGSLGRVMTIVDGDSSTKVQGITFTGGRTGAIWPADGGAAIKMTNSSPEILDCRFAANQSGIDAAVLCLGGSPDFTSCEFSDNVAANSCGALYFVDSPGASVTDCSFTNNSCSSTEGYGGAVMTWNSTVAFTGCQFSGNSALHGGGMRCGSGSSVTLTRCVFDGNFAADQAGALFIDSATWLNECTLYGNSAGTAGSGLSVHASSPVIDRTIIAAGLLTEAVACFASGAPSFTCSDIHGNAGGDWTGCISGQVGASGNFSAAPVFCDPAGGNYTLGATSPCLPGNHPDGADCSTIGAFGEGCAGPVGLHEPMPLPARVALYSTAPNPFAATTLIRYDLPRPSHVTLRVFDVTGRVVRTVVHDEMPAGRHSTTWNGHDDRGQIVSSGVYFYRLKVDGRAETRKMVRVKR